MSVVGGNVILRVVEVLLFDGDTDVEAPYLFYDRGVRKRFLVLNLRFRVSGS